MVRSILHYFGKNPVTANLIVLFILFTGLIATCTMIREVLPNFTLDMISISVIYPGADPKEIEEGICIKIEESLQGVEGIKKITSQSMDGLCSVLLELDSGYDIRKVKEDVKTQVDSISSFPENAEKPIINEIKFKGDVLRIAVWGDLPERQLKEMARSIEQSLLQMPELSQTKLTGTRNYEIIIEPSEEKLRQYGISFEMIAQKILAYGQNFSAGHIRTQNEKIRIRLIGRRYESKSYGDIPIIESSNGAIIRLSDIATLKDSFDEDANTMTLFNGKSAVLINIYKTEKEDAIKIADKVKLFVEKKNLELPKSVRLTVFTDNSIMIKDRINMLLKNGLQSLFIVFVMLWLFLEFRSSFWVTLGIPISLAGGIIIMSCVGDTLNMLSLFGLIMVIGIIVDDSIVVSESITYYRHHEYNMEKASIKGTLAVIFPVIASVITTVVAFLPLYFVDGMMGKFIGGIPTPVVAALLFSLCESLLILPVHLNHLPDPKVQSKNYFTQISINTRNKINEWVDYFLYKIYQPIIHFSLVHRYFVSSLYVFLSLIVLGLLAGGFIRIVFMTDIDTYILRTKIELPAGTPFQRTRLVSNQIFEAWKKVDAEFSSRLPEGEKLTVAQTVIIGGSLRMDEDSPEDNKLEYVIELLASEKRNIPYMELVDAWRKYTGDIPDAVSVDFGSFDMGPAGNPVDIKILGHDMQENSKAAADLKNFLSTLTGVYDIQSDDRSDKRELSIKLKDNAVRFGITIADLGQHLQAGYYGREIFRIQSGRDEIKVKVRYPEKKERMSLDHLQTQMISLASGIQIPFSEIAEFKIQESPSVLHRRDLFSCVNVSANVNTQILSPVDLIKYLENEFIRIQNTYNVHLLVEGQNREIADSLNSLYIYFPIALFLIYFIIASVFRSYLQPLIVMLTIPFSFIGAVIGHGLMGYDLSIMSMFGIVALAGIVVNDAIVLIDCINNQRLEHNNFIEALKNAGIRRFRAIFLTTITTVGGLSTLLLEKDMQAEFIKPMAISIAFGLIFATIITLIFIPCCYAIFEDFKKFLAFLFGINKNIEKNDYDKVK